MPSTVLAWKPSSVELGLDEDFSTSPSNTLSVVPRLADKNAFTKLSFPLLCKEESVLFIPPQALAIEPSVKSTFNGTTRFPC